MLGRAYDILKWWHTIKKYIKTLRVSTNTPRHSSKTRSVATMTPHYEYGSPLQTYPQTLVEDATEPLANWFVLSSELSHPVR